MLVDRIKGVIRNETQKKVKQLNKSQILCSIKKD